MEFFKKFKPKQEFKETGEKIDQKIEDQQNITIKGDVSLEDYTGQLNSTIEKQNLAGQSENFTHESNDQDLQANAMMLLEELKTLYESRKELKDEIVQQTIKLAGIEKQLENTKARARRLSLTGADEGQTYAAEDSADNLRRNMRSNKEVLGAKNSDLMDIEDEIKALESLYDGGQHHFKDRLN